MIDFFLLPLCCIVNDDDPAALLDLVHILPILSPMRIAIPLKLLGRSHGRSLRFEWF